MNKTNYRHIAIASVFILIPVAYFTGCGTAVFNVSKKSVQISLLSDGRIIMDGKQIELPKLTKKLKSFGVTSNTRIMISILKDTPASKIKAISKELVSAGFRRLMFIKPKQATSFSEKPDAI